MQQGSVKRWLAGCVCLLLSGSAFAAGPRAVAKQVQASMLLTGSIGISSAVALIEPLVNTVVFYFHEKAWRHHEQKKATQQLSTPLC